MNNWLNPDIIKEGVNQGFTDAVTLQSVQKTASTVGRVIAVEADNVVRAMKEKGILKDNYDTAKKFSDDIKREILEHYASFTQQRLTSVLQQQYPNYTSARYTRDITNLIFDSKVPSEAKILAAEEFKKAGKDFLEKYLDEDISIIRKRHGLPPAPASPDDPENIRKKEVLKLLAERENANKPIKTDSRINTDNHINSNKQTKNLVGIVFWVVLLGSYFFSSAGLLSSVLVALFFAAIVHFLVN